VVSGKRYHPLPLVFSKVFIAETLGLDLRAKVFKVKDLDVKSSKQKRKAPDWVPGPFSFLSLLQYTPSGVVNRQIIFGCKAL
jgi:hypothetical protein